MAKDDNMFKEDEDRISRVGELLADDAVKDTPLYTEFKAFLGDYKRLFKQFRRIVRMSDRQQHGLVSELEQAFESFIRTLVTVIEAKHNNTAGHSNRVTEYVLFLGANLGLKNDELEVLKYAGLLHDIGKIGIPDSVLTKNGRFTPEERNTMNQHSVWTKKILDGIRLPRSLKTVPMIAACHHEKIDGTGYPFNVKGDEIPFFSRIIAVGDVFDALTSKRDYPKYDKDEDLSFDPMSMDRCFRILDEDRDVHFDPEVVNIALKYRKDFEELWLELHRNQADASLKN